MRNGLVTFFNAWSPMSSTTKLSRTLAMVSALTRMLPSRVSSRAARVVHSRTEPLQRKRQREPEDASTAFMPTEATPKSVPMFALLASGI